MRLALSYACLGILMACGAPYAGKACNALVLGTDVSSLPVTETKPVRAESTLYGLLVAGTEPVRCCFTKPRPSTQACASVDCDAQAMSLSFSSLGGQYSGERCGNVGRVGDGSCKAIVEDGKVVGVWAFCAD